ncbi:unnamed protein product [Thelazia callipaeda]|uniref:Uncharacterized protein n=1 Tax=Thelazia callipaeda TaxID=103827 RepID=A0A0N5CTI5_THECL|nr:unnamed protein product [Thelazia callipaeda]
MLARRLIILAFLILAIHYTVEDNFEYDDTWHPFIDLDDLKTQHRFIERAGRTPRREKPSYIRFGKREYFDQK